MKAWPNDWVPFHWARPVKTPGYLDSADLESLLKPDPSVIHPDYRLSNELKKLDSNHPARKMFSLSHGRRVEHNKSYVRENINRLGLVHEIDHNNSLEAKIINLTFSLRQVQEAIPGKDPKYNNTFRTLANSLKYRRYRYLCDLMELHVDRYKRVCKMLNLEPKKNLINVPFYRPFRKVQMRKIALEYARDLKEKKVEELMASLDQEKAVFEQYKQETLQWIEEQEKKLDMIVN